MHPIRTAMESMTRPERQLESFDLRALGLLLVIGAAVRAFYLQVLTLPPYDPWRHLLLVRNIREGLGFSLFEGQPYLWYNPGWHHLLAILPRDLDPAWAAALLSWLAIVPFYLYLHEIGGEKYRTVAVGGALLLAAFGPLVRFTCHYGPEAFALALFLVALWLAVRFEGVAASFVAGLLFGVALTARLNFVFNLLLLAPLLSARRRAVALAAGLGLPLLLVWLRNARIIGDYVFVFSWDGLATRTADYNLLSTLVVQMHPAVREGLRRLHEIVVPLPEWIRNTEGLRWELMLFMGGAVLCVLLARRWWLIGAATLTLVYYLLFDASLSSNFFRIYLGLFPVLFCGIALAAARLRHRVATALVLALAVLCGLPYLRAPRSAPLEMVTPKPQLLAAEAYLVNSGFYHPESLMYRFPRKRFAGLPLYPEQLDAFFEEHPTFRSILWHDFSVQDDVALELERRGYRLTETGRNAFGRSYAVIEEPGP